MITIKVVASLNFFGQGNYCTKNLCAMCTGTKADFSQCTDDIHVCAECAPKISTQLVNPFLKNYLRQKD